MTSRRIVIAGAGSGVGKTTIATGIMSLLSKRMKVQAFKVGPDFIDPMFHSAATGRPSRNLDSFFMDEKTLKNLYGWATRDADMAVIEGVRGLYDGLTSTGDIGSTAEIAKLLRAPVVLVVNARSLAKSAAAHVLGFKMLDPEVRIDGVILNHVAGARHREKAKEAVERLTGTKVIGCIERRRERLPERHLGLVTVPEKEDVGATMRQVEELAMEVDMDSLLAIAEGAPDIQLDERCPYPKASRAGVKVAVPRDRAFSFYYHENIESIQMAGGEVVFFRPTEGDRLPDADAYYIGGGYPEIYAGQISRNKDFRDGLLAASEEGKLIYGECGGLMTLCKRIIDGPSGAPMAGVFDVDAELTVDRQGLAYVRAKATEKNFLFPGMDIRGHEFHYSRLVPLPTGPYAFDVQRGTGIDGSHDGLIKRRTIGTYMHQHALANKAWGGAFVREAAL
ncbi:MAG: hydrogenobyrinic acid a,c-diamide synthase (glutamine-hydrolyzing) [Methanomassiliicoccales archaeon]|nr:MAG: hydrogenobyrinic acid a,c-diamide synthase (glutamine-hydrolyzing) [Methanomassiliicoccales archaeon]